MCYLFFIYKEVMKLLSSNGFKNAATIFMLAILFSDTVFAQATPTGFGNITTMANNISELLKTLSIVVITIAFCFVGYQVAFANKRFADVMPVVVGAIIVGGALQLATLFATRAT
jgi:type IV secretion system protein VirB2